MKIRNWSLLFIVVSIVFAFTGCKRTSSVSLNVPDKINMYADSKQRQIAKNGSEYEETLFNRINALTNIRLPRELGIVKSEIS